MVWCGKVLAAGLTGLAFLAGASVAAATDNVTYNGGPVSHSMTGIVVDWGPNINSMYTNESSGDPGMIKYLAAQSGSTTDIGGVLAQYMDSSGHNAANQVSYGGQFQITPSISQTTLMDSQIQTELVNQIQASHLPRPAGNGLQTIYLVLFPSSDAECISSTECSANAPDASTQDFCAYHNGTYLPDGTHVLYAVLPDDTTGHQSQWCGAASTVFGDQTSYLSHEWAETISDPLGTAWWVNNSSSADYGNEIGDNCNQLMTSQGGWTVQLEWSNRAHNCVGGESTYAAPTASFLAPSVASPGQVASFDASSSTDPAADSTAISGTSYSISSGIASYAWNWGDGSTSTSTSATPGATHAYAATGNYQVSLTVTDRLGFTSTLTKTVAVTSNGSLSPVADTGVATGVSDTAATLNGTVNPENQSVQYRFVYGTSPAALAQSTPLTPAPVGQSPTNVSATLAGLSPSTTYYYRLDVVSGAQIYSGTTQSFTTTATPPPPQSPGVATGGAAQISAHAATLTGTVDAGGAQAVTYHFAYGTAATSLSSTTPETTGPAGTTSVPVSATVSGLKNHTTYYFRLDVSLGGKVYSGSVRSFTTQNPPPGASSGAATRITSSSAVVSGTVAPNGLATSYHVEFGTSIAYGHSTPAVSAGAGGAVSVSLSGLRPHTVYHYRVVATSDGGTAAGADRAFRTATAPGRAPRFSFALPSRVSLGSALRGRVHVRFRCSRGCTAHFVVSVASAQTTRFTPVAITLAGGSGRIRHRGSGTAALRFRPGVRARLASPQLRLVVYGYAVARGSARSAPRSRRLTLS